MEVYNKYIFTPIDIQGYECKKYKNAVYTIIDNQVNKHCNKCQKFIPIEYFTHHSTKRDACIYKKDGKCNFCIKSMRRSRERKYYEKMALKKNPDHKFNHEKIKAPKEKIKKIRAKMERLSFKTLKELYENLKKENEWHFKTKMDLIKKVEELELENYRLKGQEPPEFVVEKYLKVDFPHVVSSDEEEVVNKTIEVKPKKKSKQTEKKVKITKNKIVKDTMTNLANTSIVPNEMNIEKTVEYIVEDNRDYNEMLRTIEQQKENDLCKKIVREATEEVKEKIKKPKKIKPLKSEVSESCQPIETQDEIRSNHFSLCEKKHVRTKAQCSSKTKKATK